jgi:hypothetical protein
MLCPESLLAYKNICCPFNTEAFSLCARLLDKEIADESGVVEAGELTQPTINNIKKTENRHNIIFMDFPPDRNV